MCRNRNAPPGKASVNVKSKIFCLRSLRKFARNSYRAGILIKKSIKTEKVAMSAPADLPEALKPISWLVGRWKTENGTGKYPNIPEFHYHEVLEFSCIGQPMLNFTSTSRHPEKQTPMHQERGFLRIKPGTDQLAFIVSHNFGLTSLEEGQVQAEMQQIVLTSNNISRISFAKPPFVKSLKRVWKLLDQNTLEVTVYMETDDTPLTEHLKAVYTKES